VLARVGLTLGWYAGADSSVSYVPRGRGGYLIFGGEIPDEVTVSLDITRIILASAINASGPVAARNVDLSGARSATEFDWELPFAVPKTGIIFVAYDP